MKIILVICRRRDCFPEKSGRAVPRNDVVVKVGVTFACFTPPKID